MQNLKKRLSIGKFRKNMSQREQKKHSNFWKALKLSLALGISMSPWTATEAAGATNITRADGTQVAGTNGVYKVYADQVTGKDGIATNRFTNFDVAKNNIANMYFKTQNGNDEASKLFNFVQNQIDVSGTINAIKGNKVAGDMYFLSPKGMIVSGSGVINAGSLTIMAGGAFPKNNTEALKFGNIIGNPNYVDETGKKQYYELKENADGLISIAGKINAADKIEMRSSHNVKILTGAKLETQSSIDFKDLVNIKNSNGTLLVDSGLDSTNNKLVLQRTENNGNGNIVLVAEAVKGNEHQKGVNGWMDVSTSISVTNPKNTIAARVTVENNADITSDGTVSIAARSTYKPAIYGGDVVTFGNVSQTAASVDVNGNISAKYVDLTADAKNDYKLGIVESLIRTGKGLLLEGLIGSIADGAVAELDIGFIGMKSDATVNVGSAAKITASGTDIPEEKDADGEIVSEAVKALNIKANSTMDIKDKRGGNSNSVGKSLLGAGVLYARLENDATINIADNAELKTTAGSIGLNAYSETNAQNVVSMNGAKNKIENEASYGAFSINIADGYTNSKIDIGKAVVDAKKDVDMNAELWYMLWQQTYVRSSQETKASTAIGYSSFDSNAAITVGGTVTGENVNANAVNEAGLWLETGNEINEDGKGGWLGILTDPKPGNFTGLVNMIFGSISKKASEAPITKAGLFTIGATVAYADISNKASVDVKNTAAITATAGDVDLNAKQSYYDFGLYALGATYDVESKVNINASVGMVFMDDGAAITIEGDKGSNHATISSTSGDVNINADSKYEWNKIQAMQDCLLESVQNAITIFTELDFGDKQEQADDFKARLEAYQANPTDANWKAIQDEFKPGSWFLNKVKGLGQNAGLAKEGLAGMITAAQSYADATSYVNVNVGSVALDNDEKGSTKDVSVAGSVMYTDYNRKADVVVGRGTVINAGGDVLVKSNAYQKDVNYVGTVGGLLDSLDVLPKKVAKVLDKLDLDLYCIPALSCSEGSVYGGNVGVYNNNVQSGIVVAEKADLTGKSVSLNSDTDTMRLLVTLGGGLAGTTGITGMFTVSDGTISSIVAVDDEANLKATATNLEKDDKGIELNADNDALIININGDVTVGSKSAVGVGAGVLMNDFYTLAGVRDIDKEILSGAANNSAFSAEDKKYYASLNELLTDSQKGHLGSTATNVTGTSIIAPKLDINATSTPMVINVAFAGAASKKQSEDEGSSSGGSGDSDTSLTDILGSDSDLPKALASGVTGSDTATPDTPVGNNNTSVGDINGGSSDVSAFKLMGAGAVNVNKLDGLTAALLENTTVNMKGNNRAVSLNAFEDGMTIGVSGAMSIKTSGSSSANFEAMLAGTSSVNMVDMDVVSQLKNAKVSYAKNLINNAQQAEMIAAAAAPVAIDASKGAESGFNAALNASVNLVDNKVQGVMDNVTTSTTGTNVQNYASDDSTQITGGISLGVAKTTVGLGANVVFARLNNDVDAIIKGGSLTYVDVFENIAASNLTQINAAVGVGASSGQNAKVTAGALWSNAIVNNDTAATIQGNEKGNVVITAKTLKNEAIDATIEATAGNIITTWTKKFIDSKGINHVAVTKTDLLDDFGLDVDGSGVKTALSGADSESYVTGVSTTELDNKVNRAEGYTPDTKLDNGTKLKSSYTSSKLAFDANKKTLIINAGLLVEASGSYASKAVAGIGVVDSIVDNDYTAEITGATISVSATPASVDVSTLSNIAHSNSQIIDVAAGMSVATNTNTMLSASGSAAFVKLDNDTTSIIRDSNINAASIEDEAKTTSNIVTAAGAISVSAAKAGVGLAVAINDLSNDTVAKLVGTDLKGYSNGKVKVKVNAENNADVMAIGAGIALQGADSVVGAQGNVAVNMGANNAEAIIDQSYEADGKTKKKASKITNADKVDITATNSNTQLATAAGLGINGGKAGVGIGFAVNKIKDQTLAARLKNTDISISTKGSEVSVATNEKSHLTTIGVGLSIGIGTNLFSLEGAGAITLAENKQNIAELDNVHTSGSYTSESKFAVEAVERNTIISNADSISLGIGANVAAVGVGASVISLGSDTKTVLKNSKISAEFIKVNADAEQKLYNIGAGAGGGTSTVAGAGSLTINLLQDNVNAIVENNTLTAYNSMGVLAKGNDDLVNIAGALDISVGGSVGVGLAVAHNDISGDIKATVTDSTIKGLSSYKSEKIKAHSYTTNDNTNDITVNSAEEHQGLVVDAYGEHNVTDVVATAGVVAGAAGIAAALNGTGSNTIMSGTTGAYLQNSDINKGSENWKIKDVIVDAIDKTALVDVAANLSVAASAAANAAAGATVALADLNRTIEAKLEGKAARNNLLADKLQVEAGGINDIKQVTVGVGVGGSGGVSADVGAVVNSVNSNNKVTASLKNIDTFVYNDAYQNSGGIVKAGMASDIDYTSVGVLVGGASTFGTGIGLGVGSMRFTNTVTTNIDNVYLYKKAAAADASNIDFSATNYSKINPNLVVVGAGAGLAGAGVAVAVDSLTYSDKLALNVTNSNIGNFVNLYHDVNLGVKNYYDIDRMDLSIGAAAALNGVGIGVNVQPTTINSSEVMNVVSTAIYGHTVNLETEEVRNIHANTINTAGGSIAGIGVTRSYVTLGGQLMDSYSTKHNGENDDEYTDDLGANVAKANNIVTKTQDTMKQGITGALAKVNAEQKQVLGNNQGQTNPNLQNKDHSVSKGLVQATGAEGLKLNLDKIHVDGKIKDTDGYTLVYNGSSIVIKSQVKDNIDILSATGSLGIIGINLNAARLDEHIKNNVNLVNTSIDSENVSILSNVTGDAKVKAIVSTIGGGSLNVAFADVYVDSNIGDKSGNSITIIDQNSSRSITAKKDMTIAAKDDAHYEAEAIGGNISFVGSGYVEAESKEAVDNTVTIKDARLEIAYNNPYDIDGTTEETRPHININSQKSSTAEAKSIYGSLSVAAGYGNATLAEVNGKSAVYLTNNKINDQSSISRNNNSYSLQAGQVNINALFDSHAKVDMTYVNGGAVNGGGVFGNAVAKGGADIQVANNSFNVRTLNAKSKVQDGHGKTEDPYYMAEVKADAYTVGGFVGVGVNEANATIDTVANTSFTNNSFRDNLYKAIVALGADTNAKAAANITGYNVGGLLAVGHNAGNVSIKESTTASLLNTTGSTTYLESLSIATNGVNLINNQVDGRGGGVVSVSPWAVSAQNDIEITNVASIKGNYKVNDTFSITANQKDEIEIQGSTESGGVIDVAGGEITNNRKQVSGKDTNKTLTKLDNANIEAGYVNITVNNDMSLNKTAEFGMKGGSGGAIAMASPTTFTNNMDEEAGVSFVNSTLKAVNGVDVNATTKNDVFVKTSFASGAALTGENQSKATNNFNYKNNINIDANSKITTGSINGNVNMASVDDTNLQVGSYANAYGIVAAIATPTTTNTTTRTNNINIAGDIFSSGGLKLNAGQYASLANAGLNAVVDVQSMASAIIAGHASNKLENSITENNNITVARGADVASVGSTDIYANDGSTKIVVNDIVSTGFKSSAETQIYDYVGSKVNNNLKDNSLIRNNKVTIEGSVTAGAVHHVDLTIGAAGGPLVIVDDAERNAYNSSGIAGQGSAVATPELIYGDGSSKLEGIKFEKVDLSFALYEQYQTAWKAMSEYSLNNLHNKSEAYATAMAKVQALEDHMQKLGMLELNPANGQIIRDGYGRAVVTKNVRVDAVKLPDVVVSGGDITINTNNLIGNGSMEANGAPTVKITNNSNLYMILNNVSAGDKGGDIYYIGSNSVKNAMSDAATLQERNALINSINTDIKLSGFKTVKPDTLENTSKGGIVNIAGTYTGVDTYKVKVNGNTYLNKVLADIELLQGKSISNNSGEVTISSLRNNLYINGNISGKNIILSADTGSVSQNVVGALVDVGGDVKKLYEASVKNSIKPDNPDYLFNDRGQRVDGASNEWVATTSTVGYIPTAQEAGVIAGENIIIAAETININGLIQSGYEKYEYIMSEKDQEHIKNLNAGYRYYNFSDEEVLAWGPNTGLCLRQGGKVWRDGYYDYELPVYYNPTTKNIIIPKVETSGGNIYLTGKIASTGNGRIVAMDGVSEIKVDTTVANSTVKYAPIFDVKLYGLVTNKSEGKITIVDTQSHNATVITKDGYQVTPLAGSTSTNIVTKATDSSGYDYVYKPLAKQRYEWTLGIDASTRTYYRNEIENNWWGLNSSVDITKITDVDHRVGVPTYIKGNKAETNYIGVDNNVYSDFAQIDAHKVAVQGATSTPTVTRWETGLFGFTKHELYEWYQDTGTSYTYNVSVNASMPVNIKFLGNHENVSNINVINKGGINIHGDIGNKDLLKIDNFTSNVNITSTNGRITQDMGTIMANNVNLKAASSILGVDIATRGDLNLSVQNTANADTNYYHNGYSSVSDGSKNISINAELQDFNRLVNLIGLAGNVAVEGANVSAGDTKYTGGFSLTTNGNIVQTGANALITAARVDLTSTKGTIGSADKAVLVNTAEAPSVPSNSMSASLNAQAKGNIYLEEAAGDMRVGKIYSDKGDVVLTGKAKLVDALPYVEQQGRTDEELIKLWTSLGLLEDRTYIGEDGLKHAATKWDAQRLLYAIADEKINPTGVTPPKKVANVQAKNLTLNFAESAGLNSDVVTTYKISELGTKDDITDLKTLARADSTSVDWNEIEDKVTINEKLPIGVQLSGNLTVGGPNKNKVNGNVYIEARQIDLNSTAKSDINVASINAAGDVLLRNSMGSIYNAAPLGMAAIIARNIEIDAGQTGTNDCFIGSINNYLPVNMTGVLRAIGTGGVYIKQVNEAAPFDISNIFSNGDIYLESVNDIISSTNGNSRSYINWAAGKTLSLVSTAGSVGLAGNAVRILNDTDLAAGETLDQKKKVIIKSAKDAYVQGVSLDTMSKDPAPSGTVYIQDLGVGAGHSINVYDNGNIYLINASADGAVNLDAKLSIKEATNGVLQADSLSAQAVEGIALTSANNDLHNVAFYNSGAADVTIVNGSAATKDMVITGVGKTYGEQSIGTIDGNVTLTNLKSNIVNNTTIKAAGNVILDAKKGSVISNSINSAKAVRLTADQAITSSGTVTAGSNVDFVAGADVNNKGAVIAGSNVDFVAGTDVVNSGDVDAKVNVSLKANNTINNEGNVTAAVDTKLNAKDVINSGAVNAGNSVSLNADKNVTNKANITAGNNVTMNAKVGDLNNSGVVTVTNGTAELKAGQNIINGNNVTANKLLTLDAGMSIDNGGVLKSNTDDVGLVANTDIVNSGDVDAKVNVSLKANNTINNEGNVTAAVDTKLNAKNVINSGVVKAGNEATMTASNDVTNSGSVEAGNKATMTAGNDITNSGKVDVKQDVALTATKGSIVNDINGVINTGANATMTAGKDITNNGAVNAGNSVSLNANNNVTNKANITASNNVTINAKSGDLKNSGVVTVTNGTALLKAGQNILNSNNVTANKLLTLDAGISIDNSGVLKSNTADVGLVADTDIINSGEVNAKVNVSLKANNTINNEGNVTAAVDTKLNAKDVVNSGSVKAGNEATMTASNDVINSGSIEAGKDSTITATNNIENNGIVKAGNKATMTASNDITNSGKVDVKQDVALTATKGSIVNAINGVINTGANATMTAGKDITNNGAVNVGNSVSLNAENNVTNKANITASNNVTMNAKTGDLKNSGVVVATNGAAEFKAGQNIINSNNVTANKLLTLDAGISIDNSGVLKSNTADVGLVANTDIVNSGGVDAKVNVSLKANNTINNEGNVTAAVDTKLNAKNVSNSGVVKAGNEAIMTASNDVTNSGSVEAGKDSTITATNNIANSGSVNAKANTILKANNTINNEGNVTAAVDTKLNAKNVSNSGVVKAGNEAAMTASNDVTNSGSVEAGKDSNIIATNNITNSGSVNAKANTILNAGNTINNEGNVTAAVDAKLNAKDVVNSSVVKAGNEAIMTATNNVNNSGAIEAGNNTSILASNNIINNGKVNADNNVIMKANANITTSGPITAGADAILEAGKQLTNAGSVVSTKDLTLTAGEGLVNTGRLESKEGNVALLAKGKDYVTLVDIEKDVAQGLADLDYAINNEGLITAQGNITITATNGGVQNLNTLKTQGNVLLEAGINLSDAEGYGHGSDIVSNDRNGGEAGISAGGDVQMYATRHVLNSAAVKADGYVELNANTGSAYNLGYEEGSQGSNINANSNIIIQAAVGVYNNSQLVSEQGNIYLLALDSVKNVADFDKIAAFGVEFGTASGSLSEADVQVYAKQGNIYLQSLKPWQILTAAEKKQNGIVNNANIRAGKTVYIDSQNTVVNGENGHGNIKSDNERVVINSISELQNNAGSIVAKGDVYLISWQAGLNNEANIESQEGQVAIDTAYNFGVLGKKETLSTYYQRNFWSNLEAIKDTKGDLHNTGTIKALKDVYITAYNGSVINENTVEVYSKETLHTKGLAESGDGRINILAFADENYIAKHGGVNFHDDSLGNIYNAKLDENNKVIVSDDTQTTSMSARHFIGLNARHDVINAGDMTVEDAYYSEKDKLLLGVSLMAGYKLGSTYENLLEGDYFGHGNVYNLGNFKVGGQGMIRQVAKNDVINNGVMEALEGEILLKSSTGNIFNMFKADLFAGNGGVTLITNTDAGREKQNLKELFYGDDTVSKLASMSYNHVDNTYNIGDEVVDFAGTKGLLFNGGDIAAQNGEINILSRSGSIYNFDDFNTVVNKDFTYTKELVESGANVSRQIIEGTNISTGNINIIAPKGNVFNSKNLASGDNVTVTAYDGLENFSYKIFAVNNVTLSATNGNVVNRSQIESYKGDVTLNSVYGSVINQQGADIVALGGDINIRTGESVEYDFKSGARAGVKDIDGNYIDFKYQDKLAIKDNSGKEINPLFFVTENGSQGYLKADGTVAYANGGAVAYANGGAVAYHEGMADVASYEISRLYSEDGVSNWKLITTTTPVPEDKAVTIKTIVDYKLAGAAESKSIEITNKTDDAVKAHGDNAVFRNGAVINYGDLIAINENYAGADKADKGGINLISEHSDVFNYDDFNKYANTSYNRNHVDTELYKYVGADANSAMGDKSYNVATGNIRFIAPEGTVYNSKKSIVSLGDVELKAKSGLDSLGYIIYAGKDITLTATEGLLVNNSKLVSATGDITLTAEKGTVVNMLNADLFAENGSVIMTSNQDVGVDAGKKVYMVDTNGKVNELPLELPNTATSDSLMVVEKYYLKDGAETAYTDQALTADEHASIFTKVFYVNEDSTKTCYAVVKPVVGSEYVQVFKTDAAGNVIGEAIANPDSTMGNKFVGAGEVEVYHEGDVINRGDIVAKGGNGTNTAGTIGLISAYGNVLNYDNEATVNVFNAEGASTVSNDYSFDGDNYFNTGRAISFTNDEGEEQSLLLHNSWNVKSGTQLPSGKIVGTSSIDLTAGAKSTGIDPVTGEAIANSSNGYTGYLYNSFGIYTPDDLTMVSGKNLTVGLNFHFEEDVPDGISVGKNLTLMSKGGNVTNASNEPVKAGQLISVGAGKDISFAGSLKSVNGSINVVSKGGAINMGDVLAENGMAVVGTQHEAVKYAIDPETGEKVPVDGVVIGTIKGKQVILYNDAPEDKMVTRDVFVDDYLILQGDSYKNTNGAMHRLDPASKATLTIDASGAKGGVMKGDLDLDVTGNVRFMTLNVTNTNISTDDKLAIEKLHTAGVGHFNAMGYTTSTYGGTLQRDASHAIYFDYGRGYGETASQKLGLSAMLFEKGTQAEKFTNMLAKLKEIKAQPTTWHGDTNGFMNLFVDSSNYQRSNGLLLHLAKYHYVGDQRYSLETESNIISDAKAITGYNTYVKDDIGLFNRYDLISNNGVVVTDANSYLDYDYRALQLAGGNLVAEDESEEEKK